MSTDTRTPNKPPAPNAGIASQLTIEHHLPGVGELERSAIEKLKPTTDGKNLHRNDRHQLLFQRSTGAGDDLTSKLDTPLVG